ncbi:hypothetical protein BpHYR1_050483 [Brachionus plicatilis]|uniref:Uncharacterized protein n=1 Tax=Brachionus plicatilis TaxID=10195 RepID=A0A3M7QB29_BRAPC|nr:hypothetical protein BpHYR1_050483 [Brachionus plicatilis]
MLTLPGNYRTIRIDNNLNYNNKLVITNIENNVSPKKKLFQLKILKYFPINIILDSHRKFNSRYFYIVATDSSSVPPI